MDATTSPRASFSLTPLRTMSRGCTDTALLLLPGRGPASSAIFRWRAIASPTPEDPTHDPPRSPHRPRADDPLAARQRAHRKDLDHRGGAAHADEQPRSRGRRAPTGAGRLRRDRTRGPRLEILRQD